MRGSGLMALSLCLCLTLAACVGIQDAYAPPEQRKPLSVEDPSTIKPFIRMNSPDAPAQFIRDIDSRLNGGTWRWTKQNPTLMFVVQSAKNQKFSMEFTVPEITMKDTGPVTISVSINDHLLDKTTYKTPGFRHLEKPVPPDWLHPQTENIVAMQIDKMWIAGEDKIPFGFILTAIGFVE
jgi:hypothetical protein